MPAYINGLIMLEKDIKKGQSILVLGGTTEALYHHNDPKWNPTQCKGKRNNGERFGNLDLFDF